MCRCGTSFLDMCAPDSAHPLTSAAITSRGTAAIEELQPLIDLFYRDLRGNRDKAVPFKGIFHPMIVSSRISPSQPWGWNRMLQPPVSESGSFRERTA